MQHITTIKKSTTIELSKTLNSIIKSGFKIISIIPINNEYIILCESKINK
jgi:hypothetical protein